jgi:hypothetical protein
MWKRPFDFYLVMDGSTAVRNTTFFVSAEAVRMLLWCVAYNISNKYSVPRSHVTALFCGTNVPNIWDNRKCNVLWRSIEARLRNHCYGEKKAINITYYERAFLALGIQHALRMRHIVLCGLPDSTTLFFSHYLINCIILERKKCYW